jgi:VCBS repeat-containing protein
MLPVSYFEEKGVGGGSRAITINITGVNDNPVEMIEHEPVDVETTLIDYEEEDDGSTS